MNEHVLDEDFFQHEPIRQQDIKYNFLANSQTEFSHGNKLIKLIQY